MSVVGVDFGTVNTVIAVARNRGVDVITNEVSNRTTPSLVGFGPKSRYLGEAAKTQETSNLKNTVACLTRLAGRSFHDPDMKIEQQYISSPLVDVDGVVGAEVSYLGKRERFNSAQLIAMYLTKIRQTTSAELGLTAVDVVLSCPAWYTDSQRRGLIDAAEIAGWKVLRILNATTAAALGYGITKTDLPSSEEKPRRVAFVDLGHANFTCSIVEFRKGELAVKATTYDRHFGGRDLDMLIVNKFIKDFGEMYNIDINSNPKARYRLITACERLKKVLSANAIAHMNIESIMNDVDVSGSMKREEFEELIKPLLARIHAPLEQALKEAGLTKQDIDSIEMIGGSVRVPAFKAVVQDFFEKPLSYTLNQDEAVARGCALACAILSPVFRVRDFSIHDICLHPIEFTWEKSDDIPDEETSLTVFNRGNVMPSTKILTFFRLKPFTLEARYADPDRLPGGIDPFIGQFTIQNVKPTGNKADDFMVCKLKTRLNINGIVSMESAYWVEDQDVEEPVPEDKSSKHDNDSMDTSADGAPPPNPPKPKMRKVRKQVRREELPFVSTTTFMSINCKNQAIEMEQQMIMEDKLVADTEHMKNELESYLYEIRSRVEEGGNLYEFSDESERQRIRTKCEELENWLYDEGEDNVKAAYVAKLEEIKAVSGPVVKRYQDKLDAERKAREELEAQRRKLEDEKKSREAKEAAAAAAAAAQAREATENGTNQNQDVEIDVQPADEPESQK